MEIEKKREDTILVRLKPYLFCIFCSCGFGAFNGIAKISFNKGLSLYVLVAYGFAFATLSTAFLALLFERKNKSKLTLPIWIQIFFLGSMIVAAKIFYFIGMQRTSPTFAAAMVNITPSVTFILAIALRMEKFNMLELSSQAKAGGTVVSFCGATVMTLYKGITVISWHKHNHTSSIQVFDGNLIMGFLFLSLHNFISAGGYILQASLVKKYPAPMTLTALSSLVSTPISTIVAAIIDHKASSWILSMDITLVAPIYTGVFTHGIATYILALAVRMRGPVFVTAFFPLIAVVAAVIDVLIIREPLHLGGIIGVIIIILGLYVILWAQEHENKKRISEQPMRDQAIGS